MHATLHQLLILRDQVTPDTTLAAHVEACAECRIELQRLQSVTATLRSLPARWAPPDRWAAIHASLTLRRAARAPELEQRWPGWLLPSASAAVVVLAVALTWQTDRGQRDSSASAVVQTTALQTSPVSEDTRQALVAESQRLEELLTVLPEAPSVTRADTALTVADLEDRIRWVDYRIDAGAQGGIEPTQFQLLWSERVDLLNSLVAVRYAESSAPSF